MAKKRYVDVDVDQNSNEVNWVYNWNPTKKRKPSTVFLRQSNIWDDKSESFFPYNHKFIHEDGFQSYKIWNSKRKSFEFYLHYYSHAEK